MSDRRMPVGWMHVGSNILEIYNVPNKQKSFKRDKKNNIKIKHTKVTTSEELFQEGIKAAVAKQKEKEKYEQAVKDGKIQPPPKRKYNKKKKKN